MNKLSGYKQITLQDGSTVELKFGMGALELYGAAVGAKTIKEAMAKLSPPNVKEGEEVEVTFEQMASIRKLLFAGAQYAAMIQNKPITFNEWSAAEWIEQVGVEEVLSLIKLDGDEVEPTADKKKFSDTVKISQ